MSHASAVFKALADPNRRAILKLLQRGPRSAGDIADAFPLSKGTLSHHFNLLKDAELVRCEHQGTSRIYALNTSVVEDVLTMLSELFSERTQGRGRS